ncbi:MAG: Gfo/Idh/MocA family protein [bacterium]
MQVIRVGIIGCGVMGSKHAWVAAETEGLELAAVADVRRDVADQLACDCGGAEVYEAADQLLADERIDAVAIAMPTNQRTPIALKALEAGKHLLLEKPVAMNSDEVRRMIEARGDKLTVGVCSSRYRFTKSAEAARQLFDRGTLGNLRELHFRGMAKDNGPKAKLPPWRVSHKLNGGGYWVNWGCYDLDFLLGITGWSLAPRHVLAQTFPIADHLPGRVAEGSDAEEHALALVQCEGGAVLNLERGESLSIDAPSVWQVIGSKASLRLQMTEMQNNQVILDQTHPDKPLTSEVAWEGANDAEVVHSGPLTDLADAIRTGRAPMTSLENALVMQQITDAIYESADKQKPVCIK